MKELPEDIDQIGSFYKKRFEELSDSPESEVKGNLFEKMDALEGKHSKTVYLHFNVFGMKVAASLTMVIVSSLALMAVAAVTILAVKNNKKIPKTPEIELSAPKKETLDTKMAPKASKQKSTAPAIQEEQPTSPIMQEPVPAPVIEEVVPSTTTSPETPPKELPKATPLDKNGNNSKLLKDLEEDELFKKE